MRVWTVHPQYLDRQALVAVWRETLLAQAVLQGKTKGYRHHPQLIRFQAQSSPIAAIATYLSHIHIEAVNRGYSFDNSKIPKDRMRKKISETQGQLDYEWKHLKRKVEARSPDWFPRIAAVRNPLAHPLFAIRPGPINDWERVS